MNIQGQGCWGGSALPLFHQIPKLLPAQGRAEVVVGQGMEGGAGIAQTGRMGHYSMECPASSAPAWPHSSSDLPAALLAKNIPYLDGNFCISFMAKHICQGSVLACGGVGDICFLKAEICGQCITLNSLGGVFLIMCTNSLFSVTVPLYKRNGRHFRMRLL